MKELTITKWKFNLECFRWFSIGLAIGILIIEML